MHPTLTATQPALAGAPWLLAHRSMLQDAPRLITLNGQDYVLWQTPSGEICALENQCPHMGAKLSAGWICQHSGRLVCPYHALAFDGAGHVALPKLSTQPLAQPLSLTVRGDYIWSYGNHEPRYAIPTVLEERSPQVRFIGVAADMSFRGHLLRVLEINHDYNHQKGVHKDLFRIEDIRIDRFTVHDATTSTVDFSFVRAPNTLKEQLANPLLLTLPKVVVGTIDSYFPAMVIFHGKTALGPIHQVHAVYPETTDTTRMVVMVYREFSLGPLNALIDRQLLSAVKQVVQQDAQGIADLYADAPRKLRLANEEPLNWARQRYETW